VAETDVCDGSGAFAADAVSGSTVYVACQSGVAAVKASGEHLGVLWLSSASGPGAPVVAGGRVWDETSGGALLEIAPSTGRVLRTLNLSSPVTHFPWLVAYGRALYAPDGYKVLELSGL
jgi:hypothetical protein